MNRYQIIGLVILAVFYGVYFGKMLSQRAKGIRTDQMGKGKTDRRRRRIEIVMKAATVCAALADLAAVILGRSVLRYGGKTAGMVLGILGALLFSAAVFTMADSWRAGIAEHDETKLVVRGIFRISRNLAFLGFDLVYTGILLMFFSWPLAVVTLWAVLMLHLQILQEEKYLPTVFGDAYRSYRKKVCRYFGRKTWKFFLPLAAVIAGAAAGYAAWGQSQMAKIPELSFRDMLAYTTGGNPDAAITVGIIRGGEASFRVYGANAEEIRPKEPFLYEIGSLTKTFTAACVAQAVSEGRLALTDTIDQYLDLPPGNVYPTVKELLTHTSGYGNYYFEPPMILNFLADRNIYHGITDQTVLNRAAGISLPEETYAFAYSNYGYAVLGCVLESVYGEPYDRILGRLIDTLRVGNVGLTAGKPGPSLFWVWDDGDAYAPAGALKADINGMLAYAQLQLDGGDLPAMTHKSLRTVDASSERNRAMGIRMDEIGMAWIIDTERGFLWHNGGTDDYNCYLGFCPATQTAVVILSNLPPSYRIPATVMGIRLLEEIQ